MNTNPHPDDTPENDAVMVTAGQVLAFLYRHIKKLALTGIVGGAVAIGVALMLPKQWEASAALQIGQIASEAPQSPAIPIEAAGRAMERLQLPQFKDVVLQKLGLPLGAGENADTDLIRSSLKVTQLKNADLIQLTVRGFSQADAQLYAKAFLDELGGAASAEDVAALEAELDAFTPPALPPKGSPDRAGAIAERLTMRGYGMKGWVVGKVVAANGAHGAGPFRAVATSTSSLGSGSECGAADVCHARFWRSLLGRDVGVIGRLSLAAGGRVLCCCAVLLFLDHQALLQSLDRHLHRRDAVGCSCRNRTDHAAARRWR